MTSPTARWPQRRTPSVGAGRAVAALAAVAGIALTTGSTPTSASSPPQLPTLAERCSAVEEIPESTMQRIDGPDGGSFLAASIGDSPTVAILLHQTNGDGMCGFVPFASYLADTGVQAELVDLCGWGESECDEARQWTDDPTTQVAAVVDRAVAEGAERVVLVGASMGGALAVDAADLDDVDAIVDLSGPSSFIPFDIAEDASGVDVPALFAFSADDQFHLEQVEAAAAEMPTDTIEFLEYEHGHGYTLLMTDDGGWTPLADRVVDWVHGCYDAPATSAPVAAGSEPRTC